MKLKLYSIALLIFGLFLIPAAMADVTDFTSDVTSGSAPLTVSFTDTSTGNPNGWGWMFGDEHVNWTLVNGNPDWPARSGHSTVAMPDGSTVLTGGFNGTTYMNSTWRSTDEGATWTRISKAPWPARSGHSSVVMQDGSIVLLGGFNGTIYQNDVWRSTDNGATWNQITNSAVWSPRSGQSTAVMTDNSIVVMGGFNGTNYKGGVWRSTDNGATWNQMTNSAGWGPRSGHSSVVLMDNSIMLMGGFDGTNYYNDAWRSTDNGATWSQACASANWSARSGHSSTMMPSYGGGIILMGGFNGTRYFNNTYLSTDNGATWQGFGGAGWGRRSGQSSVLTMPGGNIVVMGGFDGTNYYNDVWRLWNPASISSNVQSPVHTYTRPGSYWVGLSVNYNSGVPIFTTKPNYITVTGTGTPTLSISPANGSQAIGGNTQYQLVMNSLPNGLAGYDMVVTLVDPAVAYISGVSYPSWSGLSNTTQISSGSFKIIGTDLGNQITVGGNNVVIATLSIQGNSTGTTQITISDVNMDGDDGNAVNPVIINGQATTYGSPLVANFMADRTIGTASANVSFVVNFTDMSTGTPTSWAWNFGDGGTSTIQNPSHGYITPGYYSVTLTVRNSYTQATQSSQNFIVVVPFVKQFPGCVNPPTEINGVMDDINGNGVLDYDDVVTYFQNMGWISQQHDTGITPFDYNHNGRIDYNDLVRLYWMLLG